MGGQGNLVSGRVLAEAAVLAGYRPVIGETFGASRRGGTVFTHVRIGIDEVGPLIPAGAANLILGLEPMESLRAAVSFASKITTIVLSTSPVQTLQSLSGQTKYPPVSDVLEAVSALCPATYPVELSGALRQTSGRLVLNSFVLGAAAALDSLPMSSSQIRESVSNLMLPKDSNLAAFDNGFKDLEQRKLRGTKV